MIILVIASLWAECGPATVVRIRRPDHAAAILMEDSTEHADKYFARIDFIFDSAFADPKRCGWVNASEPGIVPIVGHADPERESGFRGLNPRGITCEMLFGGIAHAHANVTEDEPRIMRFPDRCVLRRNPYTSGVGVGAVDILKVEGLQFVEATYKLQCYNNESEVLPQLSASRTFLLLDPTWTDTAFRSSSPPVFVHVEMHPPFWIAIHNPLSCHMSASMLLTEKWQGLSAGLSVLRQVVGLEPALLESIDDDGVDLVVDVGANLGTYSLFAAMLGLRVVAFEPLQARRSLCPFRRQSLRCVLLRVGKGR